MKTLKRILKNNIQLILLVLGMVIFRTAIADWHPVPSSSMEPTLLPGDFVLVNKRALGPNIPFTKFRLYETGKPQRGDIVTFYPPHSDDKLLVKRIIGVAGDRIEIQGPQIRVNGVIAKFDNIEESESAIIADEQLVDTQHKMKVSHHLPIDSRHYSLTVPEGRYFMMGDHRNNSHDSRYWGFAEEDKILGKVTRIAVSFSRERPLFNRFALKLD